MRGLTESALALLTDFSSVVGDRLRAVGDSTGRRTSSTTSGTVFRLDSSEAGSTLLQDSSQSAV